MGGKREYDDWNKHCRNPEDNDSGLLNKRTTNKGTQAVFMMHIHDREQEQVK
jgi:invasion protein IalB